MEEILQELMKTTAEKGVQKQFYSNLTITTPLQEYSDVHEMIAKGISFLERSCDSQKGFQSGKYTSRDCREKIQEIEEDSDDILDGDLKKLEVYSSTLILDLLGDITTPDSQINVSSSMLWKLKEFIAPDFGIGPFNIFKRIDNSETATLGEHNVDVDGNENDDIDKEDVCDEKEKDEEEQNEESHELLPDDCNTTSLVIWVLLREKMLERKPAESLAQLLLANGNEENGEGIIQTFLPPRTSNRKNTFDTEGCIDPVVCANVMRLLFQLELSEEGTAESTEDFLYETLENYAAICVQDQDQQQQEDHAEEAQEENTFGASDLSKTLPITNQLHTSPDAFIYFLSRAVTLSSKAKSRFWNLLAETLYDRIDMTDYPLDIAMRILTADELGLLNYDNQIRDSIVTDYQKLFKCQCEDGSWPPDSLWQIAGVHYGGKEITTAFACKAINSFYVANKLRKVNKKLSLQAIGF